MTLNEYQDRALTTALYPRKYAIVYPTLGLNGEAGEVAEKVKKTIRDNGGEFDDKARRAIAMELGDVMWYAATLANDLGFKLDEIAAMNLEKLSSRARRNCLGGSGDNR